MTIYTVELERWGINNDGTAAVKTTQGLNDALLWASKEGFQIVVLPKGKYLIEKASSVKLCSNTTYRLYECVFEKEANNLTKYNILLCDGIRNVEIIGAIVKGDRENHDYSSGGTHEWGHGIECKNSCYNISIKNCEVSECTGDGLVTSMDFSAIGGMSHPNHFSKGDIDSKGNLDITKINYTTVVKFFDITGDMVKSVGYFYYSGDGYGGYGIGCNLNKVTIKVHFYAEDGSYLGYRNSRPYEFVYLDSLPVGTAKVRFSFLQNFDLMNSNLHYVMCAKIPQYVYFFNCKSFENRRLGASINGGRFITFDGCEIFNNSNAMNRSIGCNPGYGIDIEDGYMNNQKITIRNSNIYDNRAGAFVCISTRGVYLESNKMKGNVYLSGSGDDYFSINNMYYGAITGRSITSGIEADGTFCTFRNDAIFGQNCGIIGGNTTLENCVFSKSTIALSGETVKIINCKFTFDDPDKDGIIDFRSKYLEIRNSLFDIRRAKSIATTGYGQTETAIFSSVKFLTNECNGGHYIGAKNLIVEDCEFIHSGRTANYSRMMAAESMRVEKTIFKNQSFRFDGGDIYGIESLAKDKGYITHVFSRNQIIWDAPYGLAVHEARGAGVAFIYIPRIEITDNKFEVNGKGVSLGSLYTIRVFVENYLKLCDNTIITKNDSGINTTGNITIEGVYRKQNSTLPVPRTTILVQDNKKINSNITFTSNVNNQLEKNILGNLPQSSLVSSEPTFGIYNCGELLYNDTPTVGGYIGWVCIVAGTANKNFWVAEKEYQINSFINSNGNVYKSVMSGTSGKTAPSHTSGTRTDGNVVWEYVDILAVFKRFGLISN
ncbi:right-handed parallel beta-helix repeat-containing protein [Bacillus cereus group sp. BfR-BA-01352]|uniref:right-handed parallel beta-helix repeat-containing protein n=1 Tax=Bacillus cereus group sp. BfR-BA-01352 TaxID=2920315 RepID=UPI001F5A6B01|nr:hypothetical protein [Bacillus cereus group sp. BfR-BA-01352]